jgi:Skp family chaperone for outer membrane proteins
MLSPKTPPAIMRIDKLTNVLLLVLVGVPFFISFGALRHLAEQNNISYPVLYPLMVDFGLIIFKFLALRESLRGRRDLYTWAMAITLTIISVALNIVHVPRTLSTLGLARFMAALPPLVILTAFVAVSRRIEEDARTETAIVNHRVIEETIRQRKLDLNKLSQRQAEWDKLLSERQHQLDTLTQNLNQQTTAFDKAMKEQQGQLDDLRDTIANEQDSLNRLLTQRNRLRQEIDRLASQETARSRGDKVSSTMTNPPLDFINAASPADLSHDSLTERQEAILTLLRQGKTPDDIASHLNVSARTVYRDIKSLNGLVATVTA